MTWLGGLQAAGAEEEDEEELDESKYFDMRLRMMQKLEVRASIGVWKPGVPTMTRGLLWGARKLLLVFHAVPLAVMFFFLLTHGA